MEKDLLTNVLKRYRESRDFNGLYFGPESLQLKEEAISLVKHGLVQVVSEEDYPNPHIRPWPSKRTLDQQINSLLQLKPDSYGVCLYPTVEALKKNRIRNKYANQPFRYDMSMGKGTLELAYFRFDVLEQYRNDPRYSFDFDDFGAEVSITTEADQDDDEPDEDKILIRHVGYAYDLSAYKSDDKSSPIRRCVCAFYGDLAKLTPTHQQRWRTFQVSDTPTLKPHPSWWAMQMGHWPEGIGPFHRFFYEIEALNQLNKQAYGVDLFKTTERPREFGWLLRASQAEWDGFIHQLDKLLSDNLRHKALDKLGAPSKDVSGNNLGTLKRLEKVLIMRGISEANAKKIMKPLFEIREARQRPAHLLRKNLNNKEFIQKQVHLLSEVNLCVEGFRRFWQKHPTNKSWVEPDHLAENAVYYKL